MNHNEREAARAASEFERRVASGELDSRLHALRIAINRREAEIAAIVSRGRSGHKGKKKERTP